VILAKQLGDHIDSRWQQLNSLIRMTYRREEPAETQLEQRYYISSLAPDNPEVMLKTIRAHWQVENCLHWSLDVSFREDNSRVRNENMAVNMSWLRKFCLGLLKKEGSFKASIRRKQRKVCASPNDLNKILGQI